MRPRIAQTDRKDTMRHWLKLLLPALLLSLAACAGSTDKDDEHHDGAAHTHFEDMPHDEQKKFMKEVVVPEMAKLFKAHDAAAYPKVGCKTCHGKDPKATKFEMPSADLPALDPTDQFKAHKVNDAAITEFMMKTVAPKMAELLGEPPFDPATGKGFGCFNCHTKAK